MNVIRSRKWLIALVTVVAFMAALTAGALTPRVYRGEAEVFINDRNTGAALIGAQLSADTNQPERKLQTQADLMKQRSFLAEVIEQNPSMTLETLRKQVRVATDPQADIITVDVTDSSPVRAAAIANELVQVYVAWSRDLQRQSIRAAADQVQQKVQDAQGQIATLEAVLPKNDPTGAKRERLSTARSLYSQLVQDLQRLQVTEQIATGLGSVVSSAVPDPVPVSPNPVRNGAIGLGLGLLLGVGAAFATERLNTRVSNAQDASDSYGAPILAEIPLEKSDSAKKHRLAVVTQPQGAAAEAYRGLRTNLDFIKSGREFKTLLVTSAIPGEGKSTVAANLAAVLAKRGWHVVLVVCDFHQPAASQFFELNGDAGLSEVLMGARDLPSVLQTPGDIERLQVITAGQLPPNPSELLGSVAMQGMIRALAEYADYVILDTPPILAVSDPAVVAQRADGVLLVAQVGVTKKDEARKARAQLDKVGVRVLGVAVLGVDPLGAAGYGYYNAYTSTNGEANT